MDKRLTVRRNEDARKAGVLLIGGVIGALVGVGAAYLLVEAREAHARRTGEELPLLSSGAAAKLGLLLFGLFRQINDIARGR